jgi:hypothetical protein
MGRTKIVRMEDEELRVGGITQALGDTFGLGRSW